MSLSKTDEKKRSEQKSMSEANPKMYKDEKTNVFPLQRMDHIMQLMIGEIKIGSNHEEQLINQISNNERMCLKVFKSLPKNDQSLFEKRLQRLAEIAKMKKNAMNVLLINHAIYLFFQKVPPSLQKSSNVAKHILQKKSKKLMKTSQLSWNKSMEKVASSNQSQTQLNQLHKRNQQEEESNKNSQYWRKDVKVAQSQQNYSSDNQQRQWLVKPLEQQQVPAKMFGS